MFTFLRLKEAGPQLTSCVKWSFHFVMVIMVIANKMKLIIVIIIMS